MKGTDSKGKKGKDKKWLTPQEWLNKVSAPSGLEKLVENVNYIVAPRDIYWLAKNGRGSLQILAMKRGWPEAILRSIKNGKGEHPYERASIKIVRITPNLVYSTQTFVQVRKLVSLQSLADLLMEYNFQGISKTGPLIFRLKVYKLGEGVNEYLAFYMPPIVEEWDKEIVSQQIEERMDSLEGKIVIEGYYGKVTIRPLKIAVDMLKGIKYLPSVKILRDGTHRARITLTAGTTMTCLYIQGVSGVLPSIPYYTVDKAIPVEKKPEERRHRFLGLDERGWLNLHEVGIDG